MKGRFMARCVAWGVAWGGALIVAAFFSASAQAGDNGHIRFRVDKGSADYSQGGGTWMPLKEVKDVHAGDTIRTDDTGMVTLQLGSHGGTVRLMPNTTLVIDRLSEESTGAERVVDVQLDLKGGRILGNVSKLSAASKYEIKTPNAVFGVKGTKYDITHAGCVIVVEGTVVAVCVRPDNTTLTRVVNSLERFCCDPGIVEPAPEELLRDARRNIPPASIITPPVAFIPIQPIQPPLSPIVPGERDRRDDGRPAD